MIGQIHARAGYIFDRPYQSNFGKWHPLLDMADNGWSGLEKLWQLAVIHLREPPQGGIGWLAIERRIKALQENEKSGKDKIFQGYTNPPKE